MATPEKYKHITFTPPSGARREAEYGLKLRREHGRGGTAVGIARARDLSNGVELSPSTVRRMKAYFDRHAQDQQAEGFNRGDKGWPSNGYIAAKLWGGFESGYSWAKKVVEQMNAADEKEGRSLRPYGSTHGIRPSVYVVHGPPASGKADYVASKKGDNDVVFDFNKMMSALTGGGRNDNVVSYCLDIRTLILKKALSGSSVDRTWIIATNVTDDMRKQLSDVPVQYVHVDTPKEECLRRIEGHPNEEELRKVIDKYFEDSSEQRRAPETPGVERRFLGNFSHVEKADPELLRVERRADPQTGKTKNYVVGYAARFHKDSLLLGDFVERISPDAFEIVESRQDFDGQPLQTRCLFNHSPDHLLGRFPTTMRLIVDDKGLKYECLLPESRQDLAELIERGDLRGSSFSFVVAEGGEKWTTENGRSIRVVTKIKSLLDCGPVTYPAYGDSTVAVAKRSYEQFVAAAKPKPKLPPVDVAEELRKSREFLSQRAFCKTGPGGGVDNSCGPGGGGSAKKKGGKKSSKKSDDDEKPVDPYEPTIAGNAAFGAAVGAAVGAVPGGLVGAGAGAVAGGIAGAVQGAVGKVAYKATKAINKKISDTKKSVSEKVFGKKSSGKKKASKRASEVAAETLKFMMDRAERRSGDCGRDEAGRFGSGNKCQDDEGDQSDKYEPKPDEGVFQKYGGINDGGASVEKMAEKYGAKTTAGKSDLSKKKSSGSLKSGKRLTSEMLKFLRDRLK